MLYRPSSRPLPLPWRGLLMSVWTVKTQSRATFTGINGGFDAVLGARGSKLQLVLNSIFHLENSPGNLSAPDYLDIKSNRSVALAIPIAVGDNYHGFRLVGTIPNFSSKWNTPLESIMNCSRVAISLTPSARKPWSQFRRPEDGAENRRHFFIHFTAWPSTSTSSTPTSSRLLASSNRPTPQRSCDLDSAGRNPKDVGHDPRPPPTSAPCWSN